jgi:hypothetical protein
MLRNRTILYTLTVLMLTASMPTHAQVASVQERATLFSSFKKKAQNVVKKLSSKFSRDNTTATLQLMLAIAIPLFFIVQHQLNHLPVTKEGNCGVCLEQKRDRFYTLSCGHEYCVECLQGIVDQALQSQSSALLRCPNPNCRREIMNDLLGCPGTFDGTALRKLQTQEYEAWKINHTEVDPETKKVTRECPHCRKRIFRFDDCNHMYCDPYHGGCGHNFCWLCGDDYPSINGRPTHGTNKKCSKKVFGE